MLKVNYPTYHPIAPAKCKKTSILHSNTAASSLTFGGSSAPNFKGATQTVRLYKGLLDLFQPAPKHAQGLTPEHFFIRIDGYGQDITWGKGMVHCTNKASNIIQNGSSLNAVLKFITQNVQALETNAQKRELVGVLRYAKKGWDYDTTFATNGRTQGYLENQYQAYERKLDTVLKHEKKEFQATQHKHQCTEVYTEGSVPKPYSDIDVAKIRHSMYTFNDKPGKIGPCNKGDIYKYIILSDGNYAKNAMMHVEDLYNTIVETYLNKNIGHKELHEVNQIVGEIQWLMSHAMPWARGTDAITNSLTKALYKALNIETSPLKKGISLDLEAFCTALETYKKNYASLYESPPKIINS